MLSLPKRAQLYIVNIYLLGIATALSAYYYRGPSTEASPWELVAYIALAALAGTRKVRLIRSKAESDVGSMSVGSAITFAALFRFGPTAGLGIGCISTFSGCIYPKRQPFHQLTFNVATTGMAAWAAGITFVTLNQGKLSLDPIYSFHAVAAASLVYFAINTGSVAVIIALCTGQRLGTLWKQTFLWTGPSYFAGASVSAIAIILSGNHLAAILLFGGPVAYLSYQSYAVYTARQEEKQEHIESLADLYLATIKSLALAIDAKDQYTHQHIIRVQRYAEATAMRLGLNGPDLDGLRTGALLHDIGKLGVPEYVLLKPGRLTDEEFAKIKKHPEIGAAILDPVEFPWPVLPVVRSHHERWDGTGYPDGLRGKDIPFTARILAVGDVYDALTSNRSYRNALSHEKAIEIVTEGSGTHFDPQVVEAFLEIIEETIHQMAAEGHGPLVIQKSNNPPVTSKADEAARDIQRASSELWALYEVAQTLSSSVGLDETLEILARKLHAILPGTACLFLLRTDEDVLEVRVAVGVNSESLKGSRTWTDNSISRTVALTKETYIGEYDPSDLMLAMSQPTAWTPLNSALIVPIVHQGEVLGTINLYHAEKDAFGTHDQHLLETISERAALALYNGLLFDRTHSDAVTDPLTGLFNIRYLTRYVDERCAHGNSDRSRMSLGGRRGEHLINEEPRRTTDRFALLCLDLDSFKPINDNFGHQKGDEVLRDLSSILRNAVREQDVVARYGGDEFLIVLQDATRDEAKELADRLQIAIDNYDPGLLHPQIGALRLGVSVGYACYPTDGEDCASLLSSADANMYSDKTLRKLGRLADRGAATDRVPPISSEPEIIPV